MAATEGNLDAVQKLAVVLGVVVTLGYAGAITFVAGADSLPGRAAASEMHGSFAGSHRGARRSNKAYTLRVEVYAESDDRFRQLDLSGLRGLLLAEFRKRLGGVPINLETRDSDRLDRKGLITVSVNTWKEGRLSTRVSGLASRTRLPFLIRADFEVETEEGRANWDGYHDLSAFLSLPKKIEGRDPRRLRKAHIHEMISHLFDQLPGEGRFRIIR